jgi:hypothetical protein
MEERHVPMIVGHMGKSPSKTVIMNKMPKCHAHNCDCLLFISEQIRTLAAQFETLKLDMQREIAATLELQHAQQIQQWMANARQNVR